jgi:hypothetical protein
MRKEKGFSCMHKYFYIIASCINARHHSGIKVNTWKWQRILAGRQRQSPILLDIHSYNLPKREKREREREKTWRETYEEFPFKGCTQLNRTDPKVALRTHAIAVSALSFFILRWEPQSLVTSHAGNVYNFTASQLQSFKPGKYITKIQLENTI